MSKFNWNSPKLEILSTRETAAGGSAAPDVFHTSNSAENPLPSGTDVQPPQS